MVSADQVLDAGQITSLNPSLAASFGHCSQANPVLFFPHCGHAVTWTRFVEPR